MKRLVSALEEIPWRIHRNSRKTRERWTDTSKKNDSVKEKERIIKLNNHRQKNILFFPVCFIWLFVACTACIQNGHEKGNSSLKKNEWFTLEQGRLFRAEHPPAAGTKSLLPWSVQERITDIALFRDKIYFSVNWYGILACSSLNGEQAHFQPYYDYHYFNNKTITMILPVRDTEEYILCHLYFNSMVFPYQQDDMLFNSANIVKLTHSENELFIEELYPVQPEKAPHWEIVGFLPVNKDMIHLEWKNSRNTYTEFRYSCYSVKEQNEKEETRKDFINAYNFTPLTVEETPESLIHIGEKIMADFSRKAGCTTFHFFLTEKISHITSCYIKAASVPMTDENFEIITIKMFEDEQGYYALMQSGVVYFTGKDDTEIRRISLPALPEGFHYTGFFIHDNILVLTWEELEFMNVGAAGLLLFRDDLLS
ncbi:MAG: hypothetical protein JXB88_16245 [Spirochaetales bacterium]|nr:hypothetical protein [Spirochaetales bacterium]